MLHVRRLALLLILTGACASSAKPVARPAPPRAPEPPAAPAPRAGELAMRDVQRPATKLDEDFATLRPISATAPLSKQTPKKRSR